MSHVIILTGTSNFVSTRAIGAYQIANVLRNEGFQTSVVDFFPLILHYYGIEKIKEILSKLITKETLWIGISSTFLSPNMLNDGSTRVSAKKFLQKDSLILFSDEQKKEIKQFVYSINPNIKWVVGGSRAWVKDDGYKLIDVYIEGYSDISVVEYTKFLKGKNPFLPFRNNRDGSMSIVHDKKASLFNFTTHKFNWHEHDNILPNESLPIEITRGCIFKCKFCSYPLNGKNKFDYIKDTNILLEEFIENYENFGTTNYVFLDDTYNDSPYKVELLYEKVFSKLPFKINWGAYLRLDLLSAHTETIDILKASGLKSAFFGIESLNYNSNKSVGKGMKPEKTYEILKILKNKWNNTTLRGGFILGLPNDSKESIEKWFDILIQDDYPLDSIALAVLQIFPSAKKSLSAPWLNDIELDPKKYGYMIEGPRDLWTNNTGLTKLEATDMHTKFVEKLYEKNKFGWDWSQYFGLLNLGYKDIDEIRKIIVTKNILQSEHLDLRAKNMLDIYLNRLLVNSNSIHSI